LKNKWKLNWDFRLTHCEGEDIEYENSLYVRDKSNSFRYTLDPNSQSISYSMKNKLGALGFEVESMHEGKKGLDVSIEALTKFEHSSVFLTLNKFRT
jgi:hypothetical protein